MRTGLPIAILLLVAPPAAAQAQPPSTDSTSPATVAAASPVISCASLANLRAVLRGANDDAVTAIPVITDPKSDLGCSVLDRQAVTGVADHVALNGRAYECLSLQGTNVCHWTVAGSAVPPRATPASSRPAAPAASIPAKTKR